MLGHAHASSSRCGGLASILLLVWDATFCSYLGQRSDRDISLSVSKTEPHQPSPPTLPPSCLTGMPNWMSSCNGCDLTPVSRAGRSLVERRKTESNRLRRALRLVLQCLLHNNIWISQSSSSAHTGQPSLMWCGSPASRWNGPSFSLLFWPTLVSRQP